MDYIYSPCVSNLGGIMEPMNPHDIWTENNVLPSDEFDPVQNMGGAADAMNALSFMNLLFPK
jgi:hypothetical protein